MNSLVWRRVRRVAGIGCAARGAVIGVDDVRRLEAVEGRQLNGGGETSAASARSALAAVSASALPLRRAGWDRRALHDKGRHRRRARWLCGLWLARFLIAASLGLGHFLLLLAASNDEVAGGVAPTHGDVPRERRGGTIAPNFTPDLKYSPPLGACRSSREIVHIGLSTIHR